MKRDDDQELDLGTMKELLQELLSLRQPTRLVRDYDPLHQLPEPPLDFFGREMEIAEMQEQIESGVAAGLVLQGPPGIGKTALALNLAAELEPLYKHAQFFFDLRGGAGQPRTPAEVMAHVIQAHEPETPTFTLPESLAELGELYRASLRGQRTLLVLDNVADAAQLAPLLPPAGCVLLATTQHSFAIPDTLSGLYAKQVAPLSADDSRAMLLHLADCTDEHAAVLAELCSGLPLALRAAAGGLTARVKIEPDAYLARLTELRRAHDSITAVLSLNYELLAPRRQQLWRKLAIFPASFDGVGAAAIWEMEPAGREETRPGLVKRALDEFFNLGLLERDEDERRYWLPEAARGLAAARLEPAERETVARQHAQHFLTGLQAAEIMHKVGGAGSTAALSLCAHEFLNITAGQAWAAAHAANDEEAAEWAADYFSFGIPVMIYRLRTTEIKRWLRDASEAVRRLDDAKKESELLGELANAYHHLDYPQLALEYFQKSLTAARVAQDPEGERRALGGLGDIYQRLDKMEEAIVLYQQYLASVRAEGDERAESYLLNNLGAAYGRLGRTKEALECFLRQLEITHTTGDQEHESRVLTNLGVLHIEIGQPEAATEYFSRALEVARELGDEENEAHLLDYLGGAHYLTREWTEAVEAYEEALVIARELEDTQTIGDVQWKLSMALDKLGQRARAIECAESALQIRESLRDPNAAEIRRQLAHWRSERSRFSGR